LIIATIIIVLLCVCIHRTFSNKRNEKLHKKIKEKMAGTERRLTKGEDDGDDSAFEKL
jgi:sensor domain CHASE-containing protein